MDRLKAQLQALYGDSSKHANYQSVPAFVRVALGYQEAIDEGWRGDSARYAYVQRALDLRPDQWIADVGANTGLFVLSLAHDYPDCQFVAYETHPNHVEFIRLIASAFELENLTVKETTVDLAAVDELPVFDVLLHMNVLHHAGHDYDAGLVSAPDQLDDYARRYLARLSHKASLLVFQCGYNWGGDKARPIVSPQDQAGMVAWLLSLFARTSWQVNAMAFATHGEDGAIAYNNLPQALLAPAEGPAGPADLAEAIAGYGLDRFPGEFYRRPLVVCRSTRLAHGRVQPAKETKT
jgi:hypothetical protein